VWRIYLFDVGVVFGFVPQVECNVSEKHDVSIFRSEVTKLGSGGLI
jgi:hypothetical protein